MQRLGNGIKDNIQVYNIPKFDGFHERQQPPVLEDNIKEIEAFARVKHDPTSSPYLIAV